MPLRSPKMYSFIFGFQRLVWWPKWTPASSNSFIEISTAKVPPIKVRTSIPREGKPSPAGTLPAVNLPRRSPAGTETFSLALAVLEALARALLPVLLALFHPRVARQETVLTQARAQLGVHDLQRAAKPHAHRVGLPGNSAALHRA